MPAKLLPFEQMWPTIAAEIVPLASERRAIFDSVGRVCRRELRARWDLPRFDNSAMDGFAVRAEDCGTAPTRLDLVDRDAYAGQQDPPAVEKGTACAIGTGGVLPPGADAIAIKELVDPQDRAIVVNAVITSGLHVRRRGEELRAGDVLIAPGQRLTPLRLAVAAGAGVDCAEVGRWPALAILSTGSELVAVGETPAAGQIVDTNGPLLALLCERLTGAKVALCRQVVDQRRVLDECLQEALSLADVVLLSGGVSLGDRDLVKDALETTFGVRRLFWGVAQKPGKPLYVGKRGAQWVVGLPGNPAVIAVLWPLLLRPLFLALAGASDPQPARVQCRLATDAKAAQSRTLLTWCKSWQQRETIWAEPLPRRGSHMLSDLSRASLLAIVPPTPAGRVAAGSTVEAIWLEA